MPPTPSGLGPLRPADVLNEEIRALWQRSGGVLTAEQRRKYEALLDEWAAAKQAEVDVAA